MQMEKLSSKEGQPNVLSVTDRSRFGAGTFFFSFDSVELQMQWFGFIQDHSQGSRQSTWDKNDELIANEMIARRNETAALTAWVQENCEPRTSANGPHSNDKKAADRTPFRHEEIAAEEMRMQAMGQEGHSLVAKKFTTDSRATEESDFNKWIDTQKEYRNNWAARWEPEKGDGPPQSPQAPPGRHLARRGTALFASAIEAVRGEPVTPHRASGCLPSLFGC
jgi:hypothetical protein